MTERELFEFAAKAAGHEYRFNNSINMGPHFIRCATGYQEWNPRDDDGDAFRLAVQLRFMLDDIREGYKAGHVVAVCGTLVSCYELRDPDPCAATRLAIFRAAAEVGRKMP